MKYLVWALSVLAVGAGLGACGSKTNNSSTSTGGGANGGSTASASGSGSTGSTVVLRAISGTVNGLVGSGLVLQNNGGDDEPVSHNGAFVFATKIPDGDTYAVTVGTQPSGQTCTVNSGSGTASGSDVTTVDVECGLGGGGSSSSGGSNGGNSTGSSTGTASAGSSAGFTITMSVNALTGDGLTGTGLEIDEFNNGLELDYTSAGDQTFNGITDYDIYIAAQPAGDGTTTHNQTCIIAPHGGGTASTELIGTAGSSFTLVVSCYNNTVSPLYSSHGANWLDYVANDAGQTAGTDSFATNGTSSLKASDTACVASAGSVTDYYSCLHGGEYRVMNLYGVTACGDNVSVDAFGDANHNPFVWECVNADANNTWARMISYRLADGKGLADLVDFSASSFAQQTLAVSVNPENSDRVSDPTPWWHNSFDTVTASGIGSATAETIHVVKGDIALTSPITLPSENALVVGPGFALSLASAGAAVVQSSGNFVWVEGSFNAANATSAGLYLHNGSFNVGNLLNVSGATGSADGILYGTETFSVLSGANVVSTESAASAPISLVLGSHNRVREILVTGNEDAVGLSVNDTHDCIERVRAFDLNAGGIQILGNDTVLVDVSVSAVTGAGLTVKDVNGLWLSDATILNAGGDGIDLLGVTNGTFLQVAVGNTATALSIGDFTTTHSTASQFANVALVGSTIGLLTTNTSTISYSGMKFGDTTKCSGTDCTAALTGAHTGVSFADSFVGEVDSDGENQTNDAADCGSNDSDCLDEAGSTVKTMITDWSAFDTNYSGWGPDDTNGGFSLATPETFPDPSLQKSCSGGGGSFCHIWDLSLSSSDDGDGGNAALFDVFTAPTDGNATGTHTWSDATTTTYLLNAIELSGDGIGNDNGLCESGETCLFTPNIGAYQGYNVDPSELECVDSSCGVLTAGTLTNITLVEWGSN